MLDFQADSALHNEFVMQTRPSLRQGALIKRGFDIFVTAVLMPILVAVILFLLVLNPIFNRGNLLFWQRRMGQHCKPFWAVKFRTMRAANGPGRGAFDRLEHDRITGLGHILRKTRIDELPQIVNVLLGDMSLIGPRPDCYNHARVYLRDVPGYRARHAVLPGISGLAQTEIGYVDGLEGVRRKVMTDLDYIARQGLQLDLWITWRTICVVLGRCGA
ncbi:sugar transferase [Yoonia sp. 2307UL14-13]|uniref:sugar transferase n=1 Tax=Yoonia sp. 2307UL14-13 TaxID=3126506 RepID=UPI0030B1C3ED